MAPGFDHGGGPSAPPDGGEGCAEHTHRPHPQTSRDTNSLLRPLSQSTNGAEWITSKNDLRSRPPRNQMSDNDMIRQLRREGLIGGYIRSQPLRKTRSGNISFYVPLHVVTEGDNRHPAPTKPPRLLKKLKEEGLRSDKTFRQLQERLEKAYRRREKKLHFVENRARSCRTRSKEAVARSEWRRAEIRRRQKEIHDLAMKLAEENAQRESHGQLGLLEEGDIEMTPLWQ